MFTRSELKTHAKEMLRGKWGLAVLGFFISALITQGFAALLNFITEYSISNDSLLMIIPFILTLLISSVMGVGLCKFALNYVTDNNPDLTDIFFGFKVILKALGLNILMSIAITVGFILLVVPGILLSFMFTQALYILADDTDKSIMDCLKESAAMMKGYKFKYFVLCLSFLGWILLGAIPCGIGLLWVIPYMHITLATFYLKVKENYNNNNSESNIY